MGVDVKIDTSSLGKVVVELNDFGAKEIPKAMSRAINRTISSVQTDMKREAVKGYEVISADVAKTLKTRKATKSNLSAQATSQGRPLALRHFKVKPSKRPSKAMKKKLQVKIKKSGGYQELNANPAGFWGRGNVFAREGKSRLPIRRLYSLSIPQMISEPHALARIKENAENTLQKRVEHEINQSINRIEGGKN